MYLVTCDTRLDALVVAPESAADLSDETRAVIESADFTRRPDIEAFTRPGRAPRRPPGSHCDSAGSASRLPLLALGGLLLAPGLSAFGSSSCTS
ncbi:hypothetical protein [Streptomyces spiralis]|uniref:hypothetical protein n=1 Tax=Streptomyces spiralis TaxID=66376 RepID=UPI0016736FD1|nr:hypothetical protein [Streptomyces spiralis]